MISSKDLASIEAFKGMDDGALAVVASRCADIALDAGEWLIHEGEPSRFFALISGRLEVSKRLSGVLTVLISYDAGETCGEIGLLLGSPTLSNVKATLPTRVAALETTEFWRLMHANERFAETVAGNMARRVGLLRATQLDTPTALCTIAGSARSPECHLLRDFLTRLRVPFDWDEREAGECTVTFSKGTKLVGPTVRQVAEALGLRTSPREHCYDVAIIGGGPAGLAAAVYGASEGLHTVLVERDAPGGQAGMSSRIENYLGFPSGISGGELADRAYQQVQRFGADIVVARDALGIEGGVYDRSILLDEGERIYCRCIVLATGVSYRYLIARGCNDFLNRGVYYGAAQAEARHVAGRRIHLIGGGNSAGQAAMFFSEYAEHVSIVIRAGDLAKSMSQYLIDELATRDNVSVIANAEVDAVEGGAELETIVLRNVADASTRREPTQSVFVFVGADAHTEWLNGFVATDERGYVLTGQNTLHAATGWPLSREPFLLETNQPGVFAAGDVRKNSVKRVAASVGEGSTAITMVHQALAEFNSANPTADHNVAHAH
jgi:thioredoxin reductase (NADPH)